MMEINSQFDFEELDSWLMDKWGGLSFKVVTDYRNSGTVFGKSWDLFSRWIPVPL